MRTSLLLLLAAAGAAAAADTAEDLYARATAAHAAGDLAGAGTASAAIRAGDPAHRLYWPASLLWARCATDPATGEQRLRAVAAGAPAETKRQCELEIAHLMALGERWKEAEAAYAGWQAANPGDERADEAGYWRAASLDALDRRDDAEAEAGRIFGQGRQGGPRGLAGLLLGRLRAARGDRAGAHAVYTELVAAEWAGDLRPQALLGAATTAPTPAARDPLLRQIVKGFPSTGEADEARARLGGSRRPAGPADSIGVQVGAFNNAGMAKSVLGKFTRKGRKGKVVVSQHERFGKLYVVVLGPFPSRARAEAVLTEARRTEPTAFISKY